MERRISDDKNDAIIDSFNCIHPLNRKVNAAIHVNDVLNIAIDLRNERAKNARLRTANAALLDAAEAFVTAWKKSHQLEKTDVALRKAESAIALAQEGGDDDEQK